MWYTSHMNKRKRNVCPNCFKRRNLYRIFCSDSCRVEYFGGGRFKPIKSPSSHGYIRTSVNHLHYHRLLMIKILGRELHKDEDVHHRDGNKLNNNVENLEVVKHGKHSHITRKTEINEGKVLFGGKAFVQKRIKSSREALFKIRQGVLCTCLDCGKEKYWDAYTAKRKGYYDKVKQQGYRCMKCYLMYRKSKPGRNF